MCVDDWCAMSFSWAPRILRSAWRLGRSQATLRRIKFVYWRLAAWAISAAVFAGHIGYEHVQLRCSAGSTAFHTSLSVALGAFALAVIAIVHSHGKSGHSFLAFLVWPLVIWIPAFLIALAAASMLTRTRRNN